MPAHLLIVAAATAISSATAVTTSPAVASTGVTGTAAIGGMAGSGMIAAVPIAVSVGTGMEMICTDTAEIIAAVAQRTAAVRSRPIGRPLPIFCWRFLPLLEQQQTDQKGPAHCDTNRRYFARHVVALR